MDPSDAPPGPTPIPRWAVAERARMEVTVVGRFGIHQPWTEGVGRLQVCIDPGPTFGHGGHVTTALALHELDRLIGGAASILDVGCGSGVLAGCAARAGASSVTAVDVDPDAVAWTLFNAAANDVTVEASTTPVADVPGTFDLVLANLLPAVHEQVHEAVLARVGGRLVVSGVPTGRSAEVAGWYAPLTVDHEITFEDWTALTLIR